MLHWTRENEHALRLEAERRFRERTPPRGLDELDIETRVSVGELREWATGALGTAPTSANLSWLDAFNAWYRQMAKRVVHQTKAA